MISKMKQKDFFILTWKKTAIILIIWILSTFFHNILSDVFEIATVVFFIVSVFVIPLYFVFSVIYTLLKRKSKKRKK